MMNHHHPHHANTHSHKDNYRSNISNDWQSGKWLRMHSRNVFFTNEETNPFATNERGGLDCFPFSTNQSLPTKFAPPTPTMNTTNYVNSHILPQNHTLQDPTPTMVHHHHEAKVEETKKTREQRNSLSRSNRIYGPPPLSQEEENNNSNINFNLRQGSFVELSVDKLGLYGGGLMVRNHVPERFLRRYEEYAQTNSIDVTKVRCRNFGILKTKHNSSIIPYMPTSIKEMLLSIDVKRLMYPQNFLETDWPIIQNARASSVVRQLTFSDIPKKNLRNTSQNNEVIEGLGGNWTLGSLLPLTGLNFSSNFSTQTTAFRFTAAPQSNHCVVATMDRVSIVEQKIQIVHSCRLESIVLWMLTHEFITDNGTSSNNNEKIEIEMEIDVETRQQNTTVSGDGGGGGEVRTIRNVVKSARYVLPSLMTMQEMAANQNDGFEGVPVELKIHPTWTSTRDRELSKRFLTVFQGDIVRVRFFVLSPMRTMLFLVPCRVTQPIPKGTAQLRVMSCPTKFLIRGHLPKHDDDELETCRTGVHVVDFHHDGSCNELKIIEDHFQPSFSNDDHCNQQQKASMCEDVDDGFLLVEPLPIDECEVPVCKEHDSLLKKCNEENDGPFVIDGLRDMLLLSDNNQQNTNVYCEDGANATKRLLQNTHLLSSGIDSQLTPRGFLQMDIWGFLLENDDTPVFRWTQESTLDV